MSKASEWARANKPMKFQVYRRDSGGANICTLLAVVQSDPQGAPLLQTVGTHISPIQAIEYARWILDTFEEKP